MTSAPTISYDSRCFDLAAAFLEDEMHLFTEKNNVALAQVIQDAIEEFIAGARDNYEPPDPPGFEGGFAANH